jgi:hypothetical protein
VESLIPINCLCTKLKSTVMVIIELIMKIVFQVQTNDLTQSSLGTCSSLLPNCILDSSQLDHQGRVGILYYCLQEELEKCKSEHRVGSLKFEDCVTFNFFQCPYKFRPLVEKCMDWFFSKGEAPNIEYGARLFKLLSKAHQEPEPLLRCRIYVKTNELPSLVKDS